ncbi:MAG: TetR/AcrR family transcriptional regulator [Desulfobacter sp.]|nr:MAG: TetR/AcrR family transcriptional regulator [Desulfobacter sp.]
MKTRRERVRQMTLDEIKSLSWDMVKKNGIEHLTVNGIARKMGMTPPAFYRYYKNRDQLVKALVIEAYTSFLSALETARDAAYPASPENQIYRVYLGYRRWAVDNPNMFGLFAGRKVYGFDPCDPQVEDRARDIYRFIIELYRNAWQQGRRLPPEKKEGMPPDYAAGLTRHHKDLTRGLPVELIDSCVCAACMVHGMISMEISGRLKGLAGDGETFYAYQIREIMKGQGMVPGQE